MMRLQHDTFRSWPLGRWEEALMNVFVGYLAQEEKGKKEVGQNSDYILNFKIWTRDGRN
jgi:hypothetical protein